MTRGVRPIPYHVATYRQGAGVRGVFQPNMFSAGERFRFLGETGSIRIAEARIGASGMRISEVRSTGHEITLGESAMATVLAPRSGRIDVALAEARFSSRPGEMLNFPPNTRRTVASAGGSGEFAAYVLLAPFALLSAMAAEAKGEAVNPPDGARTGGAVASAFADYAGFVLRDLGDPSPILGSDRSMRSVEALLTDFAIAWLLHAPSKTIRPLSLRRLRAAEAFMRDRFDEPLSILDVAAQVGVGLRSLELAFMNAYGLSPRGFLNAIRLGEARARLLAAADERSVTEVALACGFTHLGRFSVAYKRRFGERPVETFRSRLRLVA